MEPAPSSEQRMSGGRGKGQAGRRLGLKKSSSPASSRPPSSSPVPPPSSSILAAPSVPTAGAPISSPTMLSSALPSSPAVSSSPVPPQPARAGWGVVAPFFSSEPGNHQAPNSWYPPGGFLNFMQQAQYPPQPQMQGENFHLVGQALNFNPISPPPPPPNAYRTGTSQAMQQGNSMNGPINVDTDKEDNSEANREVKKRYWSHEEEERLASAWLNASKDPVKGNDKKLDSFWKEVTDEFNKKGNGKRRREINQLKVHWSRLKSSITDFNDAWAKATQVNTSRYSHDMLEEEAQKIYEARFGKRFLLVHWWKILKEEPKWCALFETEKDKSGTADVPEEHSRPIGREAAKAERSGKRKKENVMEGIVVLGDNIEKIMKLNEDQKVEREKVADAQLQISNANLKAKMFEVYNSLLTQDLSHMSEDQKANRDRAIRKLEEKLIAD